MNGGNDHLAIYKKNRGERASGTGYYLCTAYALWRVETQDAPDWTFSEIAFQVYPNRSKNHHKLCKALREQIVERRGVEPTGKKRRGAVYRTEDLKDLLDDRGRARAQLLPLLIETLRNRKTQVPWGDPLDAKREKRMNAVYGAVSKQDPLDLELVLAEVAMGQSAGPNLTQTLLNLNGYECHYLLWMFGGEERQAPEETPEPQVEAEVVDISEHQVVEAEPKKIVVPRSPWRMMLVAVVVTAMTVGWAAKVFYSPEEIKQVYNQQGPDIAAELEIEDTARAHLARGHALYSKGDLEQAEKLIRKGLNLTDTTFGDKAKGLYFLGLIRHRQGFFEEAVALYKASEERYARFKEKGAQQVYLNMIEAARSRAMLGELREGETLINRAYDLYKRSSWEDKEADFAQWLRIKTRIHTEQGQDAEALVSAQELYRHTAASDLRSKAEASSTLGFTYAMAGKLDQADHFTREAEDAYNNLSYEKGRIYSLLNRVVILKLKNMDPTEPIREIEDYLAKKHDWELTHYLDFVREPRASSPDVGF